MIFGGVFAMGPSQPGIFWCEVFCAHASRAFVSGVLFVVVRAPLFLLASICACLSLPAQPHLWKAMSMLSTTSRMNKICFIVDYALTKFPPSKYYPIALFGPIMVSE